MQRTIKHKILASGIGVHSGKVVNVTIAPAAENLGIRFIINNEIISATIDNVVPTSLCTMLVNRNGARVRTIEHFLATTKSLGIDNLNVYLDQDEFPIFDGSAMNIIQLFDRDNIVDQAEERKIFRIKEQIKIEDGERYALFRPVETDDFIINITCDFSAHKLLPVTYKYVESPSTFIEQIAMCRTFGFWEDALKLKEAGLALGASVENTVIFKNGSPMTEMRYPDEFIRHKVLDIIGDTSLCGGRIIGEYIGYCPGHAITAKLMARCKQNSIF